MSFKEKVIMNSVTREKEIIEDTGDQFWAIVEMEAEDGS